MYYIPDKKHVGCKVILKMFLRQMEGYSQNVSLLNLYITVTQVNSYY